MNCTYTIPAGMRDWMPEEAERKRTLINSILDKIKLWGYEEISTPFLENYRVVAQGDGDYGADDLYKLIDRDGSILALRPEMTMPVARIVSSKIKGLPPWRLMYGAEVFRYEEVQTGRLREFTQVGVELIGRKGPEADSEVVALAIESLLSVGLDDFTVSLGHMGVLRGLLASLSWDEKLLSRVQSLLLEKDFVSFSYLLEQAGMEIEKREHLLELLTCRLSLPELMVRISKLPQGIQEALCELEIIIELLKRYRYNQYIHVDLSTLRNQDYYTGMVFEIYTPGIGYPIGGGGRYDQLLHRFGSDFPATGFALGVERLLLSVKDVNTKQKSLLIAGEDQETVIAEARKRRQEKLNVVAELRIMTKKEAEQEAFQQGLELIWVEG